MGVWVCVCCDNDNRVNRGVVSRKQREPLGEEMQERVCVRMS